MSMLRNGKRRQTQRNSVWTLVDHFDLLGMILLSKVNRFLLSSRLQFVTLFSAMCPCPIIPSRSFPTYIRKSVVVLSSKEGTPANNLDADKTLENFYEEADPGEFMKRFASLTRHFLLSLDMFPLGKNLIIMTKI